MSFFSNVFAEPSLQPTDENIPLIKNPPVLSFQYHLRERNRLDHHPANHLVELEKGTIFYLNLAKERRDFESIDKLANIIEYA